MIFDQFSPTDNPPRAPSALHLLAYLGKYEPDMVGLVRSAGLATITHHRSRHDDSFGLDVIAALHDVMNEEGFLGVGFVRCETRAPEEVSDDGYWSRVAISVNRVWWGQEGLTTREAIENNLREESGWGKRAEIDWFKGDMARGRAGYVDEEVLTMIRPCVKLERTRLESVLIASQTPEVGKAGQGRRL